jgi:hypothetical protein
MRRYNIVSRILLILTVITLVLAAPALVRDERQARADVVHRPEDVIPVLGKRTREQDLQMLWAGLRFYDNAWNPAAAILEEHVPPPNPAEVHVPEVHVPPPNLAEVHVPPQGPADSDHESMELNDDAPPGSPESAHSHSPPPSPVGSTESEDWHTAPPSPGSSTESGSDSGSDYWSTISNSPGAESQSENLKAADTEMRGRAKVSRRISGTARGVDTVNAAQMQLRSAVDPGP